MTYFIERESPGVNQLNSFPFDSIIFRDVRFDTTTIAATNKVAFFSDKNKFTYVKFMGSLSGFLNTYINKRRDTADNHSEAGKLICYIKKFRITELDSIYETNVRKQRQVQIRSAIDAYYLYEDRMYPAFRSDTTFLQLLSENRETYFIIDSLLLSFAEKAGRIDIDKALKRKPFSEGYIDSMYRQRFYIPILNSTAFKKGVYTSAKDFFNNAPSISEYEWKPDKKINILYTRDENNQWVVTRKNVFGFCDGTHIWIRVENSFYPAFRRENTFEVIAPLFLKRIVNNQSYTYPVSIGGYTYYITSRSNYSSAYYKDKSVYQIDMETAEFY